MSVLPKISLVTPSYNQGRYLEQTIQSVLDQGYPSLEYIIIDGGSTDRSVEIIKKYERHLAYWISERDRGQSHAINKGFRRATGTLLGWLNSDDRLEREALRTVAEHANAYPDAGAFVGHGRIVDQAGRVIYYKEPGALTFEGFCRWLDHGNFMQPSCFFTREAWETAGPLDERIHIAFDLDLWLRMVKQFEFLRVDKLLSTALSHDSAKTTAYKNQMVLDVAIVVIKAGGEQCVRKKLDDMAGKLLFYEANYTKLMNHPLMKLAGPVCRLFVKPALQWRDAFPPW